MRHILKRSDHMKTVAADYIDYWQSLCATQWGLTTTFGIRVQGCSCTAVNSIDGGQPNTFGRLYQIPLQLEVLPNYLRMIIDDHMLIDPDSDLIDVLNGQKSFQEALVCTSENALKRLSPEVGPTKLSA